jgi:hypothetical protein
MAEEECNHRIAELYCHRNCKKSAQICEKGCKNSRSHDYPLHAHEKASVNYFKEAFKRLE